jgi:hypothetical protein
VHLLGFAHLQPGATSVTLPVKARSATQTKPWNLAFCAGSLGHAPKSHAPLQPSRPTFRCRRSARERSPEAPTRPPSQPRPSATRCTSPEPTHTDAIRSPTALPQNRSGPELLAGPAGKFWAPRGSEACAAHPRRMLLAAGCEVGARAWLRPELLLFVAAQGVVSCLLARRLHLAGAGRRRLGDLTPRLRRLSRPRTTGRPGSRVTRCRECTVHCRPAVALLLTYAPLFWCLQERDIGFKSLRAARAVGDQVLSLGTQLADVWTSSLLVLLPASVPAQTVRDCVARIKTEWCEEDC